MLEFFDTIITLRSFDRLSGESESLAISKQLTTIEERLTDAEKKISGILNRLDLFGH